MLNLQWTKDLHASDELIKKAKEAVDNEDFSLVTSVAEAITSDTEDESFSLLKDYKCADEHEKEVIDLVFLRLTGYSLKAIIEHNMPNASSEDAA